jgi:hypothetical protein
MSSAKEATKVAGPAEASAAAFLSFVQSFSSLQRLYLYLLRGGSYWACRAIFSFSDPSFYCARGPPNSVQ